MKWWNFEQPRASAPKEKEVDLKYVLKVRALGDGLHDKIDEELRKAHNEHNIERMNELLEMVNETHRIAEGNLHEGEGYEEAMRSLNNITFRLESETNAPLFGEKEEPRRRERHSPADFLDEAPYHIAIVQDLVASARETFDKRSRAYQQGDIGLPEVMTSYEELKKRFARYEKICAQYKQKSLPFQSFKSIQEEVQPLFQEIQADPEVRKKAPAALKEAEALNAEIQEAIKSKRKMPLGKILAFASAIIAVVAAGVYDRRRPAVVEPPTLTTEGPAFQPNTESIANENGPVPLEYEHIEEQKGRVPEARMVPPVPASMSAEEGARIMRSRQRGQVAEPEVVARTQRTDTLEVGGPEGGEFVASSLTPQGLLPRDEQLEILRTTVEKITGEGSAE